jgi:hypothetical protein
MKSNHPFKSSIFLAGLMLFGIGFSAFAQQLQMAELSTKLHLTDQQKKELTPIVQERDKKIKALEADTSTGKLQKLRKAAEIQQGFRDQAAKYLNADQVKKLEALQSERRAKLMAH